MAAVRCDGLRIWGGLGLALLAGTLITPFQSGPMLFYVMQAVQWLLAAWLTLGAVAVLADRQAARG